MAKFRFKDTEMQYTYAGTTKTFYCSETAYEVGDKIGQLVILPYPQIEWSETDELSDTNRGDGGFGSTGK